MNDEKKREVYQFKGHSFSGKLIGGKQCCQSCGLFALNNEFTKWAIDKGCYYDIHPEYKSVKRRTTKQFDWN